jgi:hypothetical protein
MPDGQLTLYRGSSEQMLVDPHDYQSRRSSFDKKGWSRIKAEPTTPFINYLQTASKAKPESADPGRGFSLKGTGTALNRELNALGETIMGAPGAIKSSFKEPPSKEEQKQLGISDKPGMVGKFGLGIARNVGEPLAIASEWYKREYDAIKAGKQSFGDTVDNMLTVAPEGMGTAGATEIMGNALKGMPERTGKVLTPEMMHEALRITKPIAEATDRILSGKHTDVLQEMENFRKEIKAKPSARQKDVANVKHKALNMRKDAEWQKLFGGLKSQPTDALAIQRTLGKLAEVDPVVQKWLDDNIVESKTGESVSAPLWPKVRELSSQINKDMSNPRLDRVHQAELKPAHDGLEALLKEAADNQGMRGQYEKAYQLNRKVENLKFHTAYGAEKVKPSPLFGAAGAITGLAAAESGVASSLGHAFIGKMIGDIFGKWLTPKNEWTIPKRSIAGERAIWKELGQKPPKSYKKTRVNISKEGGQPTDPAALGPAP